MICPIKQPFHVICPHICVICAVIPPPHHQLPHKKHARARFARSSVLLMPLLVEGRADDSRSPFDCDFCERSEREGFGEGLAPPQGTTGRLKMQNQKARPEGPDQAFWFCILSGAGLVQWAMHQHKAKALGRRPRPLLCAGACPTGQHLGRRASRRSKPRRGLLLLLALRPTTPK